MKVYCDASSLISLSTTCLLDILRKFPQTEFYIPRKVYNEAVQSAEEIKKFQWNGLRIRQLVEDKTLTLTSAWPEAKQVMELANNTFIHKRKPVKVIQAGEAECIGCATKQKQAAILVDERNTRMLIEKPKQLEQYIESRTKERIKVNQNNINQLNKKTQHIKIIRSTELLATAYMNGLLNNQKELEAGLNALKYAGCSVTFQEIREYKKIL